MVIIVAWHEKHVKAMFAELLVTKLSREKELGGRRRRGISRRKGLKW